MDWNGDVGIWSGSLERSRVPEYLDWLLAEKSARFLGSYCGVLHGKHGIASVNVCTLL